MRPVAFTAGVSVRSAQRCAPIDDQGFGIDSRELVRSGFGAIVAYGGHDRAGDVIVAGFDRERCPRRDDLRWSVEPTAMNRHGDLRMEGERTGLHVDEVDQL